MARFRTHLILFFLSSFIVANVAIARRESVPLMTPREWVNVERATTAVRRTTPWALGFELGTVGRRSSAGGDLAGLTLLYGGRVGGTFDIYRRWLLRGTLGFFTKAEGTEQVGVTQYNFEPGAQLFYILNNDRTFRFRGGLAQRVDILFARTVAFNASSAAPVSISYRLGPSAGMDVYAGRRTSVTIDIEGTSTLSALKPYVGTAIGLSFEM